MIKLPEHLSYDKETTAKLRTQKIFRYGDVKRFDDELDFDDPEFGNFGIEPGRGE